MLDYQYFLIASCWIFGGATLVAYFLSFNYRRKSVKGSICRKIVMFSAPAAIIAFLLRANTYHAQADQFATYQCIFIASILLVGLLITLIRDDWFSGQFRRLTKRLKNLRQSRSTLRTPAPKPLP